MIPETVIEIRREICEREQCSKRKKLAFDDPCALCPNGHWGPYSTAECVEDSTGFRRRKLGDRIASFAQPIARAIDKLSRGKTKVAGCGGCKHMQADLNAGMPLAKAIRKRISSQN